MDKTNIFLTETRETSLLLTKNDPLERIDELATFFPANDFQFKSDVAQFKNGIIASCTICIGKLHRGKYIIENNETMWVETDDIKEAKRTVIAILLDKLGFGVDEADYESDEDDLISSELGEQLVNMGMQVMSDLVTQDGQEKPETMNDAITMLNDQVGESDNPMSGALSSMLQTLSKNL